MKTRNRFRLAVLAIVAIGILWFLHLLTGGGGTRVSAASGPEAMGARGEGLDAILARVRELERREAADSGAGSLDKPTKQELQRLRFQLAAACRDSLSFASAALLDGNEEGMRAAQASLRKLDSQVPQELRAEWDRAALSLERRVGKR